MSKINRVRIMNLNYNGNSMRIDDETFDLGGETTLLSLRNGGGKTVLVQMIISLFVNKSYRDFSDRPFKSYFTTNRPTFIMTEWVLDNNQGFFLAGMMVRKNQGTDDNQEDLEMINFTGSYTMPCNYDMDNLPVIEVRENGRALKGFAQCRGQFEELKKDRNGDFNCYDMSSQYQRRQYYSKLKEYQINNKEWESIIKKVNLKESGLSELFSNAKDERGLIENWFLEAIENKLNHENDRIKGFRNLAYKFIRQYRDNQSHINKKAIIEKYFEDSRSLKQNIEEYVYAMNEQEDKKNEIAVFIRTLDEKKLMLVKLLDNDREKIDNVHEQIRQITYEKISYNIYRILDEKTDKVQDRILSENNITAARAAKENAEREICKYECSRLNDELEELAVTKTEYQERIQVLLKTQEDSRHEIDSLGAVLYKYYFGKFSVNESEQRENEDEIALINSHKLEKETARIEKNTEVNEMSEKIGGLQHAVDAYRNEEEKFNRKYNENLQRNILGKYDEGVLSVTRKIYEDQKTEFNIEITKMAEKEKKLSDEYLKLESESEDTKESIMKCGIEIRELEKNLIEMEDEKKQRLTIMKYIETDESEIDRPDVITSALDGRIKELDLRRSEYKESLSKLTKEHEKLKQGKIIELPENIVSFFNEENIQYFYGMEWLKNNGRSTKENKELVEKNPFIPYSIIMDRKTVIRLKNLREELFTGFPIPVIIRDELEQELDNVGRHIAEFGNIRFMVMFNHHLLDEKELAEILENKLHEIEQIKEKIQIKEKELEQYRSFKNVIMNQKFTIAIYEGIQIGLEQKKLEKTKLENQYIECKNRKKENKKDSEQLRKEIEKNKRLLSTILDRNDEFQKLCISYDEYENDMVTLNRLKGRKEELLKEISNLADDIESLEKRIEVLKNIRRELISAGKKFSQNMELYQNYKSYAYNTDEQEDIIQIEARYNALTQEINEDLEKLQERLKLSIDRYERKAAELKRRNEYDFAKKEYADLIYSDEIIEDYKRKQKKHQKEENAAQEKNNALAAEIAELEADYKYGMQGLKDNTGYDELLAKECITYTNFDERLRQQNYDKEKIKSRLKKNEDRFNAYDKVHVSMQEYDYLEINREMEIPDIEEISVEELNKYHGNLKRDLKKLISEKDRKQREVTELIRHVSAKPEYKDEFFKRGFDNLLSQTENPYHLKEQLNTIMESYSGILKKLQIDLENIDKEQKNVEEVFLEYICDINEDMGKIDKNSSISVRGRNLKMLRINVPEWDANCEYYKTKLHDFIEKIIKWGMEAIEANENVEETIGRIITTKKMYDEVVGIGNIRIRMYKIEEEREVLISWAEVSANSGGEGFLSAFVILSCLLSYMRRDDTDLFATGEEGKVLIMDNPFAQTNAVHLLKPLMDMAEKTNTQLICLSGLGGDSIYNRFDNIYVMKLIDSNIRNGLQYLEANHIKGEPVKKMVLSEFKLEQMSLFEIL